MIGLILKVNKKIAVAEISSAFTKLSKNAYVNRDYGKLLFNK